MEYFGIQWDDEEVSSGPYGEVTVLRNVLFGIVYLGADVEYEINNRKYLQYYYRILSILRESFLRKKEVLICLDGAKKYYVGFRGGRVEILSLSEILNRFPQSIFDKENRTLINLSHLQSGMGRTIVEINKYDCFSKDEFEMIFILNVLNEKKEIVSDFVLNIDSSLSKQHGIIILESGWVKIEKIEQPVSSKQVFVAMWFDQKMELAYQKINESCGENGFVSLRISDKEHNNEISSEILYEIRKSHFLIADVTGQRHGVYFEAGYAMALNLPVIWCCRKDDFANVHFDTRQYNHIVWESEEELKLLLCSRIKGTIL